MKKSIINKEDLLIIFENFKIEEKRKKYFKAYSALMHLVENSPLIDKYPHLNKSNYYKDFLQEELDKVLKEDFSFYLFDVNSKKYNLGSHFLNMAGYKKPLMKRIFNDLNNKNIINEIQVNLLNSFNRLTKDNEIKSFKYKVITFSILYEEILKSNLSSLKEPENMQILLETIDCLVKNDIGQQKTILSLFHSALTANEKFNLNIDKTIFFKSFANFINKNTIINDQGLKTFNLIKKYISMEDIEIYASKNKMHDYEKFSNDDSGFIITETKGARFTIDLTKVKRKNSDINLVYTKKNLAIFFNIAESIFNNIDDFIGLGSAINKNSIDLNLNYISKENEKDKELSVVFLKELLNELLTWKRVFYKQEMTEVLLKHKEMFLLNYKLKHETNQNNKVVKKIKI